MHEIIQQENLSNLSKHLQIISYITQIPEGILKDTGMELIGILVDKLEWLLETDITQTQPETSFEFKGELYHVNQNFAESAFGEYIDYDNFVRDYCPLNCIPYVLTILCKTADEKYGTYDVMNRAEAFHELPASTALSIASFFLLRSQHAKMLTESFSLTKLALIRKKEEALNSLVQWDGTGLWQDLTKIREILAHPIGEVFNMLVYQVKKAQMEEDIQRLQDQD